MATHGWRWFSRARGTDNPLSRLQIVALQEIGKWQMKLQPKRHHAWALLCSQHKSGNHDCGFLVPRSLLPFIRYQAFGERYAVIALGNTIIISMHVIWHDEQAATLFMDLATEINIIKRNSLALPSELQPVWTPLSLYHVTL